MQLPLLSTDRLQIRPLTLEDLLPCHQLYIDIGWNDTELSEKENLQKRKQWIEWSILNYQQLELLQQPPYGDRAIVLKESNTFVGLIGLVPLVAPFNQLSYYGKQKNALFTAEVGLFWAINPSYQNQGYATEAAQVVVNYAFTRLRLKRILAGTQYDNSASIAVMQKLNMRIEENPFTDPEWFQITGILNNPSL